MKRNDILEKETEIRRWISEHRSKAFICRQLHCKPTTLETYLEKLGIVYKGNQGGQGRRSAQRKPAVAYLYKGSMIKAHELKLKLIRDGIKVAKCESCNLSTWFDTAIPLELHHMNGDRFDNRLENLQILCPNCHALTHSYSDKMHKKLAQHFKLGEVEQLINENRVYQPVSVLVFDSPESYARWQETHIGLQQLVEKGSSSLNVSARQEICLHCGKPLTLPGQDTYCSRKCSRLAARKVERPSKEDLQQLVWSKPTTEIAKDFGVSDKAVEKWCKAYGIEKPQRGYWVKKQAQS